MRDGYQRIGYWLSGLVHLALILWAVMGWALLRSQPSQSVQITEIATMSGAEFEAFAAASRGAGPVSHETTSAPEITAPEITISEPEAGATDAPDETSTPDAASAQALPQPDLSETQPDLSDFQNRPPVNVATSLPVLGNTAGVDGTIPDTPSATVRPVAGVQSDRPVAPVQDQAAEAVAPRSPLALDQSVRPPVRPADLVERRNERLAQQAAEAAAAEAAALEAERLEAEEAAQRAAAELAEQQRQEAERAVAEAERIAAEEAAQRAAELAEQQRQEADQAAAAEAERLAAEEAAAQREAELSEQKRQEAERAAEAEAAQAEAERLRQEAEAEAERLRQEAEAEAERERLEAERLAREEEERRLATEREAAEQEAAEREAVDRQALEDALREAQAGVTSDDGGATTNETGENRQRIEGGTGASVEQDPLAAALSEALSGEGGQAPPPVPNPNVNQFLPRPITPRPLDSAGLQSPAEPAPLGQLQYLSQPLSISEREGFRIAIAQCWNRGALSVEASQLAVSVRFRLGADGRPDPNSPELIESQAGSAAAIENAFNVARRAILECGRAGFPLPRVKYGRWQQVIVDFRPEGINFQ